MPFFEDKDAFPRSNGVGSETALAPGPRLNRTSGYILFFFGLGRSLHFFLFRFVWGAVRGKSFWPSVSAPSVGEKAKMETDRTRLVDSGFHDTKSETEEIGRNRGVRLDPWGWARDDKSEC